MKNSIESYVSECRLNGCRVADLTGVRLNTTLPHRPLEVGCTLIISGDAQVLEQNFSAPDEPDRYQPFLPVQVKFPDGMLVCDKLFLASLTRCIQGVEDGRRFYDYARGTANQLIRSCEGWRDVLDHIRGRQLKVTDIRTHNVRDAFSGFTRAKSVVDLDLC